MRRSDPRSEVETRSDDVRSPRRRAPEGKHRDSARRDRGSTAVLSGAIGLQGAKGGGRRRGRQGQGEGGARGANLDRENRPIRNGTEDLQQS